MTYPLVTLQTETAILKANTALLGYITATSLVARRALDAKRAILALISCRSIYTRSTIKLFFIALCNKVIR